MLKLYNGWEKNPEWEEKYEFLDEIELDTEQYSFDLMGIWKVKETGEFAYALDSGCSCPMPFENLTEADLIYANTVEQLISVAVSESRLNPTYIRKQFRGGVWDDNS